MLIDIFEQMENESKLQHSYTMRFWFVELYLYMQLVGNKHCGNKSSLMCSSYIYTIYICMVGPLCVIPGIASMSYTLFQHANFHTCMIHAM